MNLDEFNELNIENKNTNSFVANFIKELVEKLSINKENIFKKQEEAENILRRALIINKKKINTKYCINKIWG